MITNPTLARREILKTIIPNPENYLIITGLAGPAGGHTIAGFIPTTLP